MSVLLALQDSFGDPPSSGILKLWKRRGSNKVLVGPDGKALLCEVCPCEGDGELEVPTCNALPPLPAYATLKCNILKFDGDTDCLEGLYTLSRVASPGLDVNAWAFAEPPGTITASGAFGGFPVDEPAGTYSNHIRFACDGFASPAYNYYKILVQRWISTGFGGSVPVGVTTYGNGPIASNEIGALTYRTETNWPTLTDPPGCQQNAGSFRIAEQGGNPIYSLWTEAPIVSQMSTAEGFTFPFCASFWDSDIGGIPYKCRVLGHIDISITEI